MNIEEVTNAVAAAIARVSRFAFDPAATGDPRMRLLLREADAAVMAMVVAGLVRVPMPRMSFGLTLEQFLADAKDVTRRLGWERLQPGTRMLAVDRVMGFKKGQRARVLGVIEVVSIRRERLDAITDDDVRREGFPGRDAEWFVGMFCRAMSRRPDTVVTRIEFRRIA